MDPVGAAAADVSVEGEPVDRGGDRKGKRGIRLDGERGDAKQPATRAGLRFLVRLHRPVGGFVGVVRAGSDGVDMRLAATLIDGSDAALVGQAMRRPAVGEGHGGGGRKSAKRIRYGKGERRFETKSLAQSDQRRARAVPIPLDFRLEYQWRFARSSCTPSRFINLV